jgi:hypothetical protein
METLAMFTGITTLVTASVVLTGAAILRGGAASADPNQDDQFLALLSQEGVPAISGVPDLIKTAHKVCGELDGGVPTDTVVDELVNNANIITPGADPGRLRRTETRFVIASARAYCPNHQGGLTNRNAGHRVKLTSFIEGANATNPVPPVPQVPDVPTLKPPQAVAPAPPKKAPPVVGPPPSSGGGGGGNGGGTGGVAPTPPTEPGIVTLAP